MGTGLLKRTERLAGRFPADALVLVLVRTASVEGWNAVAQIRARVTGSASSTAAPGAGDGVLVGHGDDQIAGHPVSVVRGPHPLGWCGRWSPGRANGNLADAPVDVEVLSAEEQQQRRESGR